jgi:hypothetical protein
MLRVNVRRQDDYFDVERVRIDLASSARSISPGRRMSVRIKSTPPFALKMATAFVTAIGYNHQIPRCEVDEPERA